MRLKCLQGKHLGLADSGYLASKGREKVVVMGVGGGLIFTSTEGSS